ncbi:N-formylglutamate amidohydrolase [Octadecabacter sp. CECT 8868]|uniref:N-formylglutamate amidohydrolase n=1 Tax=Octadecabacter algicola TaxID=2909342 RepID=UPI001F41E261|nr:N-formylglutamate amidohydrolase [Octadecabacter algicola]MCF2904768.1 N-formylglutamate amidohydrolase [Octadecabacter algicola]
MTSEPFDPFHLHGADRTSRWLITCDHASNVVPPSVGNGSLGLPDADMQRHIAYDVGAAGVTRALADALDAPAVLSNFSRMVIDPNRGLNDPTLLMKLYDGTVIPTNRDADIVEKARRVDAFYSPYHTAYAKLAARQDDTIIIAIHSFTPKLKGRSPRPWHIGILHEGDDRLSDPLLDILGEQGDLCVGDNEPYAGHLPGDSVDRHALQTGRANALIEIRSDLIETEDQQVAWGKRLAPILMQSLARMEA